ncbi:hypothetical protein Hanom_Chr04g00385461 [Helianthus anomalus]
MAAYQGMDTGNVDLVGLDNCTYTASDLAMASASGLLKESMVPDQCFCHLRALS